MPESTTRTDNKGDDSVTGDWHPEGKFIFRLVTTGELGPLETIKDLGVERGLTTRGTAWTISICTSITAPRSLYFTAFDKRPSRLSTKYRRSEMTCVQIFTYMGSSPIEWEC